MLSMLSDYRMSVTEVNHIDPGPGVNMTNLEIGIEKPIGVSPLRDESIGDVDCPFVEKISWKSPLYGSERVLLETTIGWCLSWVR
jgi:hypothetical protein